MRVKALKTIDQRRCPGCGLFKPWSEFASYIDPMRPESGVERVCKDCDFEHRKFRPHEDWASERDLDLGSSCNATRDKRGGYPGGDG